MESDAPFSSPSKQCTETFYARLRNCQQKPCSIIHWLLLSIHLTPLQRYTQVTTCPYRIDQTRGMNFTKYGKIVAGRSCMDMLSMFQEEKEGSMPSFPYQLQLYTITRRNATSAGGSPPAYVTVARSASVSLQRSHRTLRCCQYQYP